MIREISIRDIFGSLKNNFKFMKLLFSEIICQCPIPNIKRCSEILADTMSNAIPDCKIPFPVDIETSIRWYGNSYDTDELLELYNSGKLDTKENLY